MILKASQRAGGSQLAKHLLRTDDNDHVEVHELRGFVANDLHGAFREAYAISRGTRCQQFLFSLSLNPPQTATVSDREFRRAIGMVERSLGLTGQPRAIVFHEKEGRRHAHCVWSRINAETMTAINLPHFKRKLMTISRELYIKHDWRMPNGLADSRERNPTNFTRDQWQKAKRTGLDPRLIKETFQEAWAISDSHATFARALEERGFWLARGDQRGFVAVDMRGEVYSIARITGQRTRAVNERLGDASTLPSVEQTKARIGAQMTAALRTHVREAEQEFGLKTGQLYLRKRDLVRQQREERQAQRNSHESRWVTETRIRAERLPTGLRGLWDWLTGKLGKIKRQNEREAHQSLLRDQAEKQELIQRQLDERRTLQQEIQQVRHAYGEEMKALYREVAQFTRMGVSQQQAHQQHSQTTAQAKLPPIHIEFQDANENRRTGGRSRRLGFGQD